MSKTNKSKGRSAPAPKPVGPRVINFDALLGNWPTIVIGGVEIIGREMNVPEAATWKALALKFQESGDTQENLDAQFAFIHQLVTARGADVTLDWLQNIPRSFWDNFLIGLYANSWPGQADGGAEGK